MALVCLLACGAILVRTAKPQFYSPSRPALASVRRDLSSVYSEEQGLLEDLRSVHAQTANIVHRLDKADFSGRARLEVDRLKAKLVNLEQSARLSNTTPEQLTKAYQGIQARMQALLERAR